LEIQERPTTSAPLVTLTQSAAVKIKQLMAEEPDGEAAVLRVAIQGGGCSGFQYGLGFDRGSQEGDLELELPAEQLAVAIDALADGIARQKLADPEAVGVAELSGCELASIGMQDREIRQGVAARHLVRHLAAVSKRELAAIRLCDHVRRCDQEPVGRYRHRRAAALRPVPAVAAAAKHLDRSHGRGHVSGDVDQRAGIRVERFLLALLRRVRRRLVPLHEPSPRW